jgi:hypothetical protein
MSYPSVVEPRGLMSPPAEKTGRGTKVNARGRNLRGFLDAFKAVGGGRDPPPEASWPGIAVRRTASLPLAYPSTSYSPRAVKDVDARDKPGHDDFMRQPPSLTRCEEFA